MERERLVDELRELPHIANNMTLKVSQICE
jgi:hypothetical protein